MGSGIVQNRRIISNGRSSLSLDYYPGVFDRMRSNAPTVSTITKKTWRYLEDTSRHSVLKFN